MKKTIRRVFAALLLLTTITVLLCSCKNEPEPTTPKALYEQYLELALEDMQKAQDTYVYFRNELLEDRAKESEWSLQSYEINEWKQLNEDLYVAITTVQNNSHPEPYQIANFVGRIDGEFRVILGILNLPDVLKDSFDYTEYLEMDEDYLGEVRFDDPSQLPPHEELYRRYMDYALDDFLNARKEYVTFGSDEIKQLSMQSKEKIYHYEIKQWEQLNDHLWVVCNEITGNDGPREIFNFVVKTDDAYQLILSVYELPSETLEGVDISRFISDDSFSPLA